jgi:Cdc6-like AAA superfamily ATPase
METMNEWFGLKPEHNDFAIETDENARLFFARHDLQDRLQSMLKRSFRTGNPPKMVLYGDWGVGKTHTMRHIEYVIGQNADFPAIVVFKELPDITKKSTFQVAHASLLDALGFERAQGWVHSFMAANREYEKQIQEWSQSGDIAAAFATLLGRGDSSRAAWDWLRGVTLSAADARATGLGPALSQSNEFVRVLQIFGKLCRQSDEKMLIFMLDEATKLDAVSDQDAINHWTNAFKLISDQQTKDFGFIVSISCVDVENMAVPLQDEQVQTRFGESSYIALETMDTEKTKEFISALLSEWIDEQKRSILLGEYNEERDEETVEESSFPFTLEGLDLAVEYACRNGGISRPRDIQQTLDDLLNRAIDEDRHILSSTYVRKLVNG